MIVVSNGKEKITLKKGQLQKRENEYVLQSKNKFLNIELDFIIENNSFTKILKCYSSAVERGDILKEYENKITNENEIRLKNSDYYEFANLIKNFNNDDSYRKEALIETYSELLAYECFVEYVLEDVDDVDVEEIFVEYIHSTSPYRDELISYKYDIYSKANEKLKNKYKVDLSYVFVGGNKDE